jgi:pimeloyl-ACP methyl ester carboxylesterase
LAEARRREIALTDGPVSVLDWGGAGHSIHFAHANGFNAATYAPILATLAGRGRIFASDLRGHGFTGLPADPVRMKSWTVYRDDLIALLEALGAGPYILAGHSMGGASSLLVAAKRPDLVKALVLFEPVLMPWQVKLMMALMRVAGRTGRVNPMVAAALRRRSVFASKDAARASYKGRGAFKTWPDAALDGYLEGGLITQQDGTLQLACAPAWEAANFSIGPPFMGATLARIKAPLTILHGTIASTTRPSMVAAIQRLIPQAVLKKIEGATHFLPIERPDLTRDALAAAL